MTKIRGKKLALNRETLVSLSRDALDHIGGGQQQAGAISDAVKSLIGPCNERTRGPLGCITRDLANVCPSGPIPRPTLTTVK